MPETQLLAAFPLPIVIFPDEEVRLHIFEQRYRQLIHDCDENGTVFAIIPVINTEIQSVGAIMKLLDIVKIYDDGRMDIKLNCMSLFINKEFNERFPGKLYGSTLSEWVDFDTRMSEMDHTEIMELFNELCSVNHVQPYHSVDWEHFISYKLAHYVGFTLEQEYEFSSIQSEQIRMTKLITQIKHMIEQSKLRQNWLSRINLNGEYRNITLEK